MKVSPTPPASRPIFDLIANRPLAKLQEAALTKAASPCRAMKVADSEVAISCGQSLTYSLWIVPGATLSVQLDPSSQCDVNVRVTEEGTPSVVHHVPKPPVPEPGHYGTKIYFGLLPARLTEFAFSVDRECAGAKFRTLELVSSYHAPTRPSGPPPKNVIFWLTDNTRADRVQTWNPAARAKTPVLDSLAKRGVLFKNAYVQGNESRVSHASIWSAMYPAGHKMISQSAVLSEKIPTMAEVIGGLGLDTFGVTANGWIQVKWGFKQGWKRYKNHLHEGGGLQGEHLVKSALSMVKNSLEKNSRFFLYVGTIDAHVSWRAHEPWISEYDGVYKGKYKKALLDPELDLIAAGKVKLSPRDKQRVLALYDSDISYNDQQLGVLLAELERTGHRDDTMIVVTSDHGEEFWERGKIGHGQSLYDELVRVPLLIVYPPLFPAGTVVNDPVDVMDAVPTIVEALGGKAPDSWQAASLGPLTVSDPGRIPGVAIATAYDRGFALRAGDYKLIEMRGKTALYDMAADPGEKNDLSGTKPKIAEWLKSALDYYKSKRANWKKTTMGSPINLLRQR